MAKIIQKENPILRQTAREIPTSKIKDQKTKKLLEKMRTTLEGSPDGVALAAPQIGESLRVFIISPRAFAIQQTDGTNLVYINPTIVKKSAKKSVLDEGCLSVQNIFGKIKRSDKVTITATDENGQKFTRGASGLLAEIFQHETDHLNGILFTDTATDLVKVEKKANDTR